MDKFTRAAFLGKSEQARSALCQELAAVLLHRLKTQPDFHRAVFRLVSELRELGHDLWSFDEDDDREIWCPNYAKPSGPGIVVTFETENVKVEWSLR